MVGVCSSSNVRILRTRWLRILEGTFFTAERTFVTRFAELLGPVRK